MSTENFSQQNNREVSFEDNDDDGELSQVSSGEHDDDGDEESPTSAAFIAMLKKWLHAADKVHGATVAVTWEMESGTEAQTIAASQLPPKCLRNGPHAC